MLSMWGSVLRVAIRLNGRIVSHHRTAGNPDYGGWMAPARRYSDGVKRSLGRGAPLGDEAAPAGRPIACSLCKEGRTMPAQYRADQVGSLLRPLEVLEAHVAFREGRIPLEELRRVEDA